MWRVIWTPAFAGVTRGPCAQNKANFRPARVGGASPTLRGRGPIVRNKANFRPSEGRDKCFAEEELW